MITSDALYLILECLCNDHDVETISKIGQTCRWMHEVVVMYLESIREVHLYMNTIADDMDTFISLMRGADTSTFRDATVALDMNTQLYIQNLACLLTMYKREYVIAAFRRMVDECPLRVLSIIPVIPLSKLHPYDSLMSSEPMVLMKTLCDEDSIMRWYPDIMASMIENDILHHYIGSKRITLLLYMCDFTTKDCHPLLNMIIDMNMEYRKYLKGPSHNRLKDRVIDFRIVSRTHIRTILYLMLRSKYDLTMSSYTWIEEYVTHCLRGVPNSRFLSGISALDVAEMLVKG